MSYKIAFSGNEILFGKYELEWNEKISDINAYNQYLADVKEYNKAIEEKARIDGLYGDNEYITDENGNIIPRPNVEVPEIPNGSLDLQQDDFMKDLHRKVIVYSDEEKANLEEDLKNRGIQDYNVEILPYPSEWSLYKLKQKSFVRPNREAVENYVNTVDGISTEYLIEQKMRELKDYCQSQIFKGFKANVLGEDFERTYELKILDQTNYNSQMIKFNLDSSLEGVVWSSNEGPAYYTKDQFMALVPYIDSCLNYNWNIFYVVKYQLESMTDKIAIDSLVIMDAWAAAKIYIDSNAEKPDDENNRTDEIVKPEEIPPVPEYDFAVNDEPYLGDLSLNEVIANATESINITLNKDISISKALEINLPTFINLNGHYITSLESAINANADLTINSYGENISVGGILAGSGGNYTCINVRKGTTKIQEGFYLVGADAEGLGNSCIYLSGDDANIEIYGGRFSTAAAYKEFFYVLNKKNGVSGDIEVYGGTFVNYNPVDGDDANSGDTFLMEGYTTEINEFEDNIEYTVIPQSVDETSEPKEEIVDETIIDESTETDEEIPTEEESVNENPVDEEEASDETTDSSLEETNEEVVDEVNEDEPTETNEEVIETETPTEEVTEESIEVPTEEVSEDVPEEQPEEVIASKPKKKRSSTKTAKKKK